MNPNVGTKSAPAQENKRAQSKRDVELTPGDAPSSSVTQSSSVSGTQIPRLSIEEQIRDRAYQLYVERGYQDGSALQDWIDAELELMANR